MLERRNMPPEIGVCIARDVQDTAGRLLIKAGTELTAKHIRALKMWGIGSVVADVENGLAEGSRSPVLTPEQQATIRARVASRFRFAPVDHPVMERLFACSLARCGQFEIRQEASHAL